MHIRSRLCFFLDKNVKYKSISTEPIVFIVKEINMHSLASKIAVPNVATIFVS